MNSLRDEFMGYCVKYAYGKEREIPMKAETSARYLRGLKLVEKIIGHSLDTVSETDQINFIEGIASYEQGTRRVSTQIFQRFIAWGIKNGHLTCDNVIIGKEEAIIGPNTPTSYKRISRRDIKTFMNSIDDLGMRCLFGIVYYCGATSAELTRIHKANVGGGGIIINREVLKETIFYPLPSIFMVELNKYCDEREGLLFDIEDSIAGRYKLNQIYRNICVNANVMIGTTFRDFRTSAIRHYYEYTNDIDKTRQFAGVTSKKKGWLVSLLSPSEFEKQSIAKVRKYYGRTKPMESVRRGKQDRL